MQTPMLLLDSTDGTRMRYFYRAECRRVVEADVLDLDIDLGCSVHAFERCGLFGVDAPKTSGVSRKRDEYRRALAAKRRTSELVMDRGRSRPLLVETVKDEHDRLLVWVWSRGHDAGRPRPRGESVNMKLIAEGHAEQAEQVPLEAGHGGS